KALPAGIGQSHDRQAICLARARNRDESTVVELRQPGARPGPQYAGMVAAQAQDDVRGKPFFSRKSLRDFPVAHAAQSQIGANPPGAFASVGQCENDVAGEALVASQSRRTTAAVKTREALAQRSDPYRAGLVLEQRARVVGGKSFAYGQRDCPPV